MSEQPPLASPSGATPSFEPYSAPAYGEEPALPAPSDIPAPPPGFAAGPGHPGAGPGWAPYPLPPQGAPYQVAPQYLGHLGAPTHPLATASLVLGLIGIFSLALTPFLLLPFVGVVCSPFAIWLGARARREIRTHPQSHGGDGIAMAGFVTGIIGVVLGILGLLAILAFVVFIATIFSSTA